MKECPHCKLVSPDSTEHCDCGYDFASGAMQPPSSEKQRTDYTGLVVGAMLIPVFLLFVYVGKADMGLAACIVLGMAIIAIKLRWRLRKHLWFWATIILIFVLHVPLLLIARWPQGKVPTIAYSMPIGIADFFIILGAIGLAEKVFLKGSSSGQ